MLANQIDITYDSLRWLGLAKNKCIKNIVIIGHHFKQYLLIWSTRTINGPEKFCKRSVHFLVVEYLAGIMTMRTLHLNIVESNLIWHLKFFTPFSANALDTAKPLYICKRQIVGGVHYSYPSYDAEVGIRVVAAKFNLLQDVFVFARPVGRLMTFQDLLNAINWQKFCARHKEIDLTGLFRDVLGFE